MPIPAVKRKLREGNTPLDTDDDVRRRQQEGEPSGGSLHLALADVLKRHHVELRRQVAQHGGDVEAAWAAALGNAASLQRYAEAMQMLSTTYWEPLHSDPARCNDDRLEYIVQSVRRFLLGTTEADRAAGFEPGPPLIVTLALKEARRKHFAEHQQAMSSEAADVFQRQWLNEHVFSTDSGQAPTIAHVRVLDVGSCFNPLPARFRQAGLTAHSSTAPNRSGMPKLDVAVVGVDLEPHPDATDVLRGDWSRTDAVSSEVAPPQPGSTFFDESQSTSTAERCWYAPFARASTDEADRFAIRVAAGSFHVVTFCLLLSYLPTPSLRARCIENAHRALRMHGMLVVVSTRTQGSRSGTWIDEWIAAIEAVGFRRLSKDVRQKLVGLCFQKTQRNASVLDDETSALLRVVADDVGT